MATTNLTSHQIATWKNNLDTAIGENLKYRLKYIENNCRNLRSLTNSGVPSTHLYEDFDKLGRIMWCANSQLSTFMKAFDEDLTRYITTVKNAENALNESVLRAIDQFAEAADKISKLSI